jgi:hypothetical protein
MNRKLRMTHHHQREKANEEEEEEEEKKGATLRLVQFSSANCRACFFQTVLTRRKSCLFLFLYSSILF